MRRWRSGYSKYKPHSEKFAVKRRKIKLEGAKRLRDRQILFSNGRRYNTVSLWEKFFNKGQKHDTEVKTSQIVMFLSSFQVERVGFRQKHSLTPATRKKHRVNEGEV